MNTMEENSRTIQTKKTETFKIQIWEDRTRGSRWTPIYDASSLKLINDDYVRTQNIRVTDTGMRYFEFMAQDSGKYELVFELRYGWKFSAEERIKYNIEVVA